ncbi:cytochrome P450 [Auricularia subglabra TFB-10046 SS5]|nr:cytochrome P450 [Auricularia subglabra TFB-10046 SS5]
MAAILDNLSHFTIASSASMMPWLSRENAQSIPGGTLTIFVVSLGVAYVLGRLLGNSRRFPPGPSQLPLFGNAFQVPTENTWLYFAALAKKFGPMVRLSLAGSDILVLDRLEDAEELLVKRSGNYSSRKQLVYAGKYRSGNKRLVLLPYGPMLKKQRAAFFQMLNAKVVGAYEHIQERGTMKLLARLTNSPTDAYLSIKHYAAETLMNLVYAREFGSDGADLRTLLGILESFVTDIHPRAHLVDTFPALDYLPDFMAPWRREARRKHAVEVEFYSRLLLEVKGRMDGGESLECFAARLWENNGTNQLDLTTLAYIAGSAFEAGTDNTAGTILWFLVAGLYHPQAMRMAQEELDRVLGADGYTAPSFHHLDQLPWMPVAPVSGPHHSLNDDEYKGYKIRAGTTGEYAHCDIASAYALSPVMANVWAIHHDEGRYPDPFVFNPERFLKQGENLRPESLHEGHYGFGFGRRACPGQHLASKSVFIAIARLLWAFDISPPLDDEGRHILPDPAACRHGITAEPDTFGVLMKPRSDTHAQTINQSWPAARGPGRED